MGRSRHAITVKKNALTHFTIQNANWEHAGVDRHVVAGNGNKVAVIWDSPVTGSKEKITYKQLLEEVSTFAAVLREEGVKKGDVVLVYSKYLYDRRTKTIISKR